MLHSNIHCPCFDSSFSSLIMAAYPGLTMYELSSSFLFVQRIPSLNVQQTCRERVCCDNI